MERTQRVAKLEALLARVQSRSNRGETHGNAAVAIAQPATAPVARVAQVAAAPVVHAPPPQAAPSPKPSPVAASAPPVIADPPARAHVVPVAAPVVAAAPAAHEMQEDVATVIRDVPPEALAAIAAATAQQAAAKAPPPAAGAPPPAAAPAASVAPAFRGTSAFGGLSKKMTLIGTAPPANWPSRGADASSTPPPEPQVAAPAPIEEEAKTSIDEAPQIQATESEGDLDALLGDENSAPPAAAIEERAPEPVAAAHAVTQASTAVASAKAMEPVASKPIVKSRSSTTVIAMIALWIMLIAVIWFVYRSSM